MTARASIRRTAVGIEIQTGRAHSVAVARLGHAGASATALLRLFGPATVTKKEGAGLKHADHETGFWSSQGTLLCILVVPDR